MKFKVLVSEDSDSKIAVIKSELLKLGAEEDGIIVAKSGVDTRRALKEHSGSLNLMLLDLALPNRTGDLPVPETGMELLKQILDDGEYVAPDNIVGTTADFEILSAFESGFNKYTTQILLISPGEQEWKFSLSKLVKRIERAIAQPKDYKVDVCFVTALRYPELESIKELPIAWSPEQALGNGVLFQEGTMVVRDKTLAFICAHSTQMGTVAASFMTAALIDRFCPRLLIMTGICGGLPGTRLGDLIISNRSWDWQSGKWLHSGLFEAAPDHKEATPELVGLAQTMEKFVYDFWISQVSRPSEPSSLRVGPMLSGSAVVEDKSKHATFLHQHRKAIAVDMECYGVYFAAQMCASPRPKVLCIKAVSDLADRNKKDKFQKYCSDISAVSALEVVKMYYR